MPHIKTSSVYNYSPIRIKCFPWIGLIVFGWRLIMKNVMLWLLPDVIIIIHLYLRTSTSFVRVFFYNDFGIRLTPALNFVHHIVITVCWKRSQSYGFHKNVTLKYIIHPTVPVNTLFGFFLLGQRQAAGRTRPKENSCLYHNDWILPPPRKNTRTLNVPNLYVNA